MGMTRSRLMGTYLPHSVPKYLTTHRMSKNEFQPDFRNPQMLSFLNMYKTMGSKMKGLAVRERFLSKNAEKQRFWGPRFWINRLRRGLAPTIFDILIFSHVNCPNGSQLKIFFEGTTENGQKRRFLLKPLLLDIFVRQTFLPDRTM